MAELIEPRTLQGFRDYPPALMIPRERVLQTAREVYRSYGYAPIDTPALEYSEVLLGKGGGENDRIVYRFKDNGNDASAHIADIRTWMGEWETRAGVDFLVVGVVVIPLLVLVASLALVPYGR